MLLGDFLEMNCQCSGCSEHDFMEEDYAWQRNCKRK